MARDKTWACLRCVHVPAVLDSRGVTQSVNYVSEKWRYFIGPVACQSRWILHTDSHRLRQDLLPAAVAGSCCGASTCAPVILQVADMQGGFQVSKSAVDSRLTSTYE